MRKTRILMLIMCSFGLSVACRSGAGPGVGQNGGDYIKISEAKKRVVVFVHGVFGDQSGTWRNAKGEEWPALMAGDPEMAPYDVYVVDYYSPFRGRAADIDEIGVRLRQQFDMRGIFKYQEIYFITHSMGGLITKSLLFDLHTTDVETLRRVKAVIFLSTPAHGAPVADIAGWISNNPQIGNMSASELNSFLQRLERQWQALLRERDQLKIQWPRVYCAYEKQAVAGRVLVVPRLYTTSRCDEDPYPMEEFDHISIAKPLTRQSDQYTWAKARIMRIGASPASVSLTEVAKRREALEARLDGIDEELQKLYAEYEPLKRRLDAAEEACKDNSTNGLLNCASANENRPKVASLERTIARKKEERQQIMERLRMQQDR